MDQMTLEVFSNINDSLIAAYRSLDGLYDIKNKTEEKLLFSINKPGSCMQCDASCFTCGLRCSRGTDSAADKTLAPASRAALPPCLMPGPPCRRRSPEWAGPASERRRQHSARSALLCQGARPVSPPALPGRTPPAGSSTRSPPGSLVEVSATESRGECRGRGDGGPGPQPSAPPASARSALAAWPRPGAGGLLPASRPSPGSAPRAAGGGRSPSTAGPGSLRRGCAAACRGSVRRLEAGGRALAVSGPDRVRSPLPACPRPLAAPSGLGRPPLGKVTFRFVSAPRWRANRSPLAFLLFPTAYLFLWREKVS